MDKDKSKHPSLLDKLLSMAPPDLIIINSKVIRKFLDNSRDEAEVLSQFLYWTPRSSMKGKWIAKSDKELSEEIGMKRYGIRKATQSLCKRKILEKGKTKKFAGSPTQHYRVNEKVLNKLFSKYIRLSENEQSIIRNQTIHYPNSDNQLSENKQSSTEITTETTQRLQDKEETSTTAILNFYKTDFGNLLTEKIKGLIMKLITDYTAAWVHEAMDIAVKRNKKSLDYVEGILKIWKKEGKTKGDQNGKPSRPKLPANNSVIL